VRRVRLLPLLDFALDALDALALARSAQFDAAAPRAAKSS
jgi:hypothetical protein